MITGANLWDLLTSDFCFTGNVFSFFFLVRSLNGDFIQYWLKNSSLLYIVYSLNNEIFATLNFFVNRTYPLKSSDYILLTFLTQQLLRLLLSLFLLDFGFHIRRTLITVFCLSLQHIYPLHVFLLISLSYPDLSRCDTDDGTRTLDPFWWRVNKPSLGVPEALLDFRPIDGWLKGILIKRKSRGKKAWWQTKKLNLSSSFL